LTPHWAQCPVWRCAITQGNRTHDRQLPKVEADDQSARRFIGDDTRRRDALQHRLWFAGRVLAAAGCAETFSAVVLEIAFDSIQPSTRHASGLAMRFPRIKAIRRDKTLAEIDTLAHARRLVANANAYDAA